MPTGDHLSGRGIAAALVASDQSRADCSTRSCSCTGEGLPRTDVTTGRDAQQWRLPVTTPHHFSPFIRFSPDQYCLCGTFPRFTKNVWHVSIPSFVISRPPLAALHESAVTNGNGVRTFLPLSCDVRAITCPSRTEGVYRKVGNLSRGVLVACEVCYDGVNV